MPPSDPQQGVDCRVSDLNQPQTNDGAKHPFWSLLKVDTAVIHVRGFALRLRYGLSNATENQARVSLHCTCLPSAIVIILHTSYSTRWLSLITTRIAQNPSRGLTAPPKYLAATPHVGCSPCIAFYPLYDTRTFPFVTVPLQDLAGVEYRTAPDLAWAADWCTSMWRGWVRDSTTADARSCQHAHRASFNPHTPETRGCIQEVPCRPHLL